MWYALSPITFYYHLNLSIQANLTEDEMVLVSKDSDLTCLLTGTVRAVLNSSLRSEINERVRKNASDNAKHIDQLADGTRRPTAGSSREERVKEVCLYHRVATVHC
jgi:hypothetical protein